MQHALLDIFFGRKDRFSYESLCIAQTRDNGLSQFSGKFKVRCRIRRRNDIRQKPSRVRCGMLPVRTLSLHFFDLRESLIIIRK